MAKLLLLLHAHTTHPGSTQSESLPPLFYDIILYKCCDDVGSPSFCSRDSNGGTVPPINTLSHRVIFTDASNLLSSHERFLARLRGQGVGKDLDEVIATLVLELLTESNVHNEYLDNLEETLAELEKCAFKSQSFLTWLTHKRALHTVR